MNAPKFSKPFDANHAKAGAPYCQADGDAATIFKWDLRSDEWVLAGVISDSAHGLENIAKWSIDGVVHHELCNDADLMMIPLGLIDGRPVFVDDEIEMNLTGGWTVAKVKATWAGTWGDDRKLVRWPTLVRSAPGEYTLKSVQDFIDVPAVENCRLFDRLRGMDSTVPAGIGDQ